MDNVFVQRQCQDEGETACPLLLSVSQGWFRDLSPGLGVFLQCLLVGGRDKPRPPRTDVLGDETRD